MTTLTATVVEDLHREGAALRELDPESDVGFFAMSPASAEQVTQQIRTVLDRGWEYIALAYKGRAFAALCYPTWDAYVDARFGDFRIAVPREHRAEAVAALAGVRMSVRAIAKLLGVGVGTVHRELAQLSGVPDGTPDDSDGAELTLGRDGKRYPRRRLPPRDSCPTCGECHSDGPQCPWEQIAQGVVPGPDLAADAIRRRTHAEASEEPGDLEDLGGPAAGSAPDGRAPDAERRAMSVLARLRPVADQLARLPELLAELELAIVAVPDADRSDLSDPATRRLIGVLGERLQASLALIEKVSSLQP